MFLGQLSEKEKNAFLSLSIHVSNSNGIFADEEKEMIQAYCKEMGIPFAAAEHVIPMDEVIAVFRESELQTKKIVLLETLGLVYSDGKFDDSEKGFIHEYVKKIGLTDEDMEKQTEAIREYLAALKKVTEAIS